MTPRFSRPDAEIFVPAGGDAESALARTTHLGIGAHQDDLELMAIEGILACFRRSDSHFTGVTVCDGAGSTRSGLYADVDASTLVAIRREEQRKAARIGEYSAQIQLGFASLDLKNPSMEAVERVVGDLEQALLATTPRVVYTHNLADKHDTHVAVALRVVAACRKLPLAARPERVIGCEVWRDLDWLTDSDKLLMQVDERENLRAALMGVFDSQISAGKRYDLAAEGRRRAHATFLESHAEDRHTGLVFGMDLTPLITGSEPLELVRSLIQRFEDDVVMRLARMGAQAS